MTSHQKRKSHCGDKTILWPSYLHNGISYTGKMTSLHWIGAQSTKAYSQKPQFRTAELTYILSRVVRLLHQSLGMLYKLFHVSIAAGVLWGTRGMFNSIPQLFVNVLMMEPTYPGPLLDIISSGLPKIVQADFLACVTGGLDSEVSSSMMGNWLYLSMIHRYFFLLVSRRAVDIDCQGRDDISWAIRGYLWLFDWNFWHVSQLLHILLMWSLMFGQ